MSIAKKQIITVTNKILEEAFKEGIILTVDQLTAKVNQIFADASALGQPTIKYRPAPYRGNSNPEDWNLTVDEVDTDLRVLYEENLEQMQRILTDFDYFEVEKRKLERQTAMLEDRIEELLLLNSNIDGYLYSVYDQFRTLEQIDTANTTAWVDLPLRFISLPHAKTGNVKVDLSGKEIIGELLTTNGVTTSEIEPVENILDDNINSSWIQKIVSDRQVEVKYQVSIKLDGNTVNRVVLNPHVPSKTRFQILYTEDDLNWKVMGDQTGQEIMAFDFSSAWFKGIKIVIYKSSYDEKETDANGNQRYVYYVGITNLSLLKIGYEDYAELYSTPLEVKDRQGNPVKIDKVSLQVTEHIPQDCSLNYYVALQKEDQFLEWQPITPIGRDASEFPKVIDIKSLSGGNSLSGLAAISAQQYIQNTQALFNGLAFWCLNAVNSIPTTRQIKIDGSSPSLYKGVGQVRVESFSYDWPDHEQHKPGPADWIDLPKDLSTNEEISPKVRYIDTAQTLAFTSGENKYNYRIITSLYLSKANDPISTRLTINSAGLLNVHVLINNMPVITDYKLIGSTSSIPINYGFTEGWNTLTIYVYKPDAISTQLNLGVSPSTITNKIRVDQESMTYVPLFEYLYNTFEKDTDRYTVSEDNRVVISDMQKKQGAKYEFHYSYGVDQGYTNFIKIKAELLRGSDSSVTPRLSYYKVRVT
jgi:hypothetical protein